MVGLGAVLRRASKLVLKVDQNVKALEASLEPSKRNAFEEKTRPERSKRIQFVESLRREIPHYNLPPLAEFDGDIESAIEDVQVIEPYITTDRQKILVRDIGLHLLYSVVTSAETALNAASYAVSNPMLVADLRELRNQAERIWRLTTLTSPADEQEFREAVMWAYEQGDLEELTRIQVLLAHPPYHSESILALLFRAEARIKGRLIESSAVYRVLCSLDDFQHHFPRVCITEVCPAFIMVVASSSEADRMRKVFPVELSRFMQESTFEPGESDDLNRRDQVIKFKSPVISTAWPQQLAALDIVVLQSLSRLEMVVSVSSRDALKQLKHLDIIDSVSPYTPRIDVRSEYLTRREQTITSEMLYQARISSGRRSPTDETNNVPILGILIASFFTQNDREQAANSLATQEIRVVDCPGKTKLVLDVRDHRDRLKALNTISNQVGLKALGEKRLPKLSNDKAGPLIGCGGEEADVSSSLKLTGENEIVAIADTGLDTGSVEYMHPDFKERVAQIKSYPITPTYRDLVSNVGEDSGAADRFSGHGTHVAGSILGNGKQAICQKLPAIPKGTAPKAKLVFQAVEQVAQWTEKGIEHFITHDRSMPPVTGLLGIPEDVSELFEDAYEQGARIHSNSWGFFAEAAANMPQRDQDLDAFIWENKDFFVLVAAGNDGHHSSTNSFINQGSLRSPGFAKNCLTVGASESDRLDYCQETYREKHEFEHEPFASSGVTDSVENVAAFSSRGPCHDQRRKPDVVAPGVMILSTRSSQIAGNNFAEGAYLPSRKSYMFMSGTSMATPLVAGCAAQIRQYFKEKQRPPISEPSAALIKATLIHSAQYLSCRYPHPFSRRWADNEQGWGRVCLQKVLDPAAPAQTIFMDQSPGLNGGDKDTHYIVVESDRAPLRITLVYTDYPGETLVNNLNLLVWSPNKEYFLGNDFDKKRALDSVNNVEGVVVESPSVGEWKIEIVADVQQGPQDYALVISGHQTLRA